MVLYRGFVSEPTKKLSTYQGTEYSEPLNNSSSRGSANALILYGGWVCMGWTPALQAGYSDGFDSHILHHTDTAVQEWLRLE